MRKDKARDIARSVLPSTARKSARDNKREYHARHRHAQRQVNHAIERSLLTVDEDDNLYSDPDLFDDFEDLDTFDGYHAATTVPSISWDNMNEIVDNRRGHDKLGPLISWATATEKDKMAGWSDEDKIAYFKAILPDSLQGRHALGHVKSALRLEEDPFRYGRRYRRPDPFTLEDFRAGLSHCLATTKSRQALREFLYETVPVAAHTTQTNNKVLTREQARDEEGRLRFLSPTDINPDTGAVMCRYVTPRPHMVDVYVPQTVSVTCDACTFLRNDPLANTAAVNRFVEIVWAGRPPYDVSYWRRPSKDTSGHPFLYKIIEYVRDNKG
jgi:hypothetical protein